jgi:hypothetical protein
MLAHKLKEAVSKYWLKKRMSVTFEIGLCKGGRLRADVLAVSMSRKVICIECKSSVADFRSDKKWYNYKAYCDQFYFAMDHATYLKVKAEIPKGIGIFVIKEVPNRSNTKTLLKASIVQRAKWEPIDDETRMDLFVRMVFRTADLNRYKRNT